MNSARQLTMFGRSWLGLRGLRGRIVGVVLATTVATLSVAALALLGRLEGSLRTAARVAFRQDVVQAEHQFLRRFQAIDYDVIEQLSFDPHDATARQTRHTLLDTESAFGNVVGARTVEFLGFVDAHGQGYPIINPDATGTSAPLPPDRVVARALHADQYGYETIGGTQYVYAAVPVGDKSDAVLVVDKAINEIPDAVSAVQVSFLLAASAGLLLTLLLAIPLSATLVRRLRTLHESALRLAADGTGAAPPVDRSRDEIGDLSRTFALMQERLRHQEEARRAFVATASHELRTPLTSLDMMLELLAEDLRAGEVDIDDAQVLLERARAQSRRLGRLAADLLDLSRIDADVALRSEPVELGELSRAVLAEFELGTDERGVGLALDEAGGSTWALGDPGSIARIVRILLDNAVRVAPRGSEITISLRQSPVPSVSVSDEGPGVLAQEQTLIFERFKRGHDHGAEAGFGLGLAIGRELAERMGGTLVLAQSRGSGATFTLTLAPAQAPAGEHAPSVARS